METEEKEYGQIQVLQEDKMELWNSWCKTDPDVTKSFRGKGGFRGTAVSAQHQIKNATKRWGIMGYRWGVKDESYDVVNENIVLPDGTNVPYRKIHYRGVLYYPTNDEKSIGRMHISSDIDMFNYSSTHKTWSPNNDVMKKVSTDAITKGLSRLGMNSDVFEGRFDDNKYVSEMREEFGKKEKAQNPQQSYDTNEEVIM